jgi:hypothetical protein
MKMKAPESRLTVLQFRPDVKEPLRAPVNADIELAISRLINDELRANPFWNAERIALLQKVAHQTRQPPETDEANLTTCGQRSTSTTDRIREMLDKKIWTIASQVVDERLGRK